jgi:hypothetical protein
VTHIPSFRYPQQDDEDEEDTDPDEYSGCGTPGCRCGFNRNGEASGFGGTFFGGPFGGPFADPSSGQWVR